MCEHGDTVELVVNVPDNLSHTKESRWDYKLIDSCLSDIVNALNNAEILTMQSCCGHGKGTGEILLQDGRKLLILQNETN